MSSKILVCEIAYKDDPTETLWVNICLGGDPCEDNGENVFFVSDLETKEDFVRLYNQDTSDQDWYVIYAS